LIGNIKRVLPKVSFLGNSIVTNAKPKDSINEKEFVNLNVNKYKHLEVKVNNDEINKKIFLAHRGAWNNKCVENSIQSFENVKKNISSKLHGFECDFRQISQTEKPAWVIMHDENLYRFNGGDKINLNSIIIQNEMAAKIPSLNEFCKWCKTITEPVIINIEIKTGTDAGISYLIDSLNKANKNQQITYVFSSFDKCILSSIFKKNESYNAVLFDSVTEMIDKNEFLISDNCLFFATSYDFYEIHKEGLKLLNKPCGVYFKNMSSYKENVDKLKNDPFVSIIFLEV